MNSKKRAVRIVNPVAGHGYTSAKQAIRFLKRGQARLRTDLGDNVIEMIETDYRHLAALARESTPAQSMPITAPAQSPSFEIVPSSTGTNEYATFARYPIFPEVAFRWA